MPRPRACQYSVIATISMATIARTRSTACAPERKSIIGSSSLSVRPRQPGQMGDVLEEDPDMRQRPGAHQRLVHVGVPGQSLHVAVAADRDKALAALVAGVPVALH